MEHETIIGSWIDPLNRRIALTLERWKDHILVRHADMAVRLEEVGKTLEDPEAIFREPHACVYYRMALARRYFKVVVGFGSGAIPGRVITAYKARKINEEGTLEWKKN